MHYEDEDCLTIRMMRQIIPLSRITIYKWVKKGKFPEPFRIGRNLYWKYKDFRNWLEQYQKKES